MNTAAEHLSGALTIPFAGQKILLLPQHAVWWPDQSTLFIADVHLGKEATFRAAAIPVPDQTHRILQTLSALIHATRAKQLIILGDLIHARRGRCPDTFELVHHWRQSNRSQVDILLVRGNHDRAAGDPPRDWHIHCTPEPTPRSPFSLHHFPPEPSDSPSLAGHLHPVVRLTGPARDSLRLPCFLQTGQTLVLPAFSTFVDGKVAAVKPGDRVFAIAENQVLQISDTPRSTPHARKRRI